MADFAPLNADEPPELLQRGLLMGEAIGLNLTSIEEHAHSRAANILKARRRSARRRRSNASGSDSSEPSSAQVLQDGLDGDLLAIKVVFAPDVREPHNIRKEIRIMASLDDDNICPLLNAYYINSHYVLALPFFSKTLAALLDEPTFTPSVYDPPIDVPQPQGSILIPQPKQIDLFPLVAQSIIKQMCKAVAHLEDQQIAHRDISPSNWLISQDGHVVLTDFGVAWSAKEPGLEGTTNLYFELGTGPFRAPELLFGSKAYNPFALDRWALGVNIASLFTHIGPKRLPSPEDSDEDDPGRWPRPSFLTAAAKAARRQGPIKRSPLFEGGLGDFALIGSIFKIRGTPTLDKWPEAKDLPDFGKFHYKSFVVPAIANLLPNLPPSDETMQGSPVDLIDRMLVYPFGKRLSAKDALELPYLRDNQDFKWKLDQVIPASEGAYENP